MLVFLFACLFACCLFACLFVWFVWFVGLFGWLFGCLCVCLFGLLFVGLQELNKLVLVGRHSKEADCLCPEDELQLLQAEQKLVSLADPRKAAMFAPVLVQHCELLECAGSC